MQEDLEIVAEALQSKEKLTQFLRTIEPFIYQTAYYMTGKKMDAEDVTQDCLWKVCRSLTQYQGQGSLRGWVHRVVVNTVREQARKKKAQFVEFDDTLRADDLSVEMQVEMKMTEENLHQAIAALPDNYREVLVLRHIHDLSYQEIAETLELTEAQVKTRLFRGREKLRTLFTGGEEA